MSRVLYRKYRSQNFDELVGQEHVASLLKNAVSQQQTAHAYLFHGPRGLGKTSTARILAKAVNCLQLQPDGNPCCECENCKSIENGNFLDLIEIDAASNRGIDQIRELKERIEFSPSEGKFKVYIIDEVHMLTTEAFNALLKTLEEPPEHAVMILATTEIHKVPPTILSRCQRFDFRLGTRAQIKQLLTHVLSEENFKIEDAAMDLIIDNARGSYRDALSLLDVVVSGQLEGKDPKKVTEEEVRGALGLADSTMSYFFLEKLVNGESGEALDLIEELSSKGVNLGQFIKFDLSVLRDILVGDIKGKVDYNEYSFAKKLDRQNTLKLINLFVEAERELKNSVIPTLPLEMLIAKASDIFEASNDNKGNSSNKSPSAPVNNSDDDNSDESEKAAKAADKSSSKSVSSSKSFNSGKDLNKKTDTEKTAVKSGNKLTIELKKIKKKWSTILQKLGDHNSHLYAFMGRAKVLGLEEGILKLAVAFDFHKDRLESVKSRDAVSKVFKDVFGCPVKISCVVDDSVRGNTSKKSDREIIEEEFDSQPEPSPAQATGGNAVTEVFGSELVDVA
jgi:DNA polymerase-3 subunit gamma/tau